MEIPMKKILFSTLSLALISAAHADMYVETTLGSVTKYVRDNESASKNTIGVGLGYEINPNFAVVAKYQSLYKDSNIKSNALSIRGVVVIPIDDNFSVNAKLGIGRTQFKDKNASLIGNINYGFGADYAIDRQISVGLDVDFYPTKETDYFYSVKQTNIGANVKYKF
jgi:hypothetical protein